MTENNSKKLEPKNKVDRYDPLDDGNEYGGIPIKKLPKIRKPKKEDDYRPTEYGNQE